MTDKKANRLLGSTSPYLLQHAHNPVEWYPWGPEALEKAQNEDKPIIVSIGYSACHWCHVMERESFENEDIAALMNQHFVNIKVDREERPDIDAIYMEAVQAMGMQGGWPLNAFLTPEAKPFYAGTYFPPRNWAALLQKIARVFQNEREGLEESAESFRATIARSEMEKYGLSAQDEDFPLEALDDMVAGIVPYFDTERGGMQKAPKFPMPSIYAFLLQYSQINPASELKQQALTQVELTLQEMAWGGIYDQIGGGFARYSVDGDWLVPHFEKMLYDNGQLISLYAQAYSVNPRTLYQETVYQSIDFVARELKSPEGGFYSALDADSEGEEGKFYVWTYDEIEALFPEEKERALLNAYYQNRPEGNWEEGKNILHRRLSDESFAAAHQLSPEALKVKVKEWQQTLFVERSKRIRPGLDDKILTSWNALMLKGLVDAYKVFQEDEFLSLALENARFIFEKLATDQEPGIRLQHSYKDGQANIAAYLEDYALLIEAWVALYQISFDLKWLERAEGLANYAIVNFYDESEEMFFFTDAQSESLIARKKELFDNVIPASNSVMAKALQQLGLILDKPYFVTLSRKMTSRIKNLLHKNVEYLANWAQVYIHQGQASAEIVILGDQYWETSAELNRRYLPNKVLLASKTELKHPPLFQNRKIIPGETQIYVCYNKTCQLPVNTVEEAWAQIK